MSATITQAPAAARVSAVANVFQKRGFQAEYVHLDITDDLSIATFSETVQGKLGGADIVVNGAGWGQVKPFWEMPLDLWGQIVTLNLIGPMKLVKSFLPKMMERNQGKIVNVSSDAGRVGSSGETVYAGAKGGLIAFTKSLAREVARYNINVNCVCPGPTETPLLFAVPEKHLEAFKRAIPFRRFGKPQEVADAILFFASSRSDYITGQVLSVNGGLTMVG